MAHLTSVEWWWIAFFVTLALWDLAWRGYALWQAARHHHNIWFICLLVLNTVGILPIIYLTRHVEET